LPQKGWYRIKWVSGMSSVLRTYRIVGWGVVIE
jgi:hypothetical protein